MRRTISVGCDYMKSRMFCFAVACLSLLVACGKEDPAKTLRTPPPKVMPFMIQSWAPVDAATSIFALDPAKHRLAFKSQIGMGQIKEQDLVTRGTSAAPTHRVMFAKGKVIYELKDLPKNEWYCAIALQDAGRETQKLQLDIADAGGAVAYGLQAQMYPIHTLGINVRESAGQKVKYASFTLSVPTRAGDGSGTIDLYCATTNINDTNDTVGIIQSAFGDMGALVGRKIQRAIIPSAVGAPKDNKIIRGRLGGKL